MIKLKQTIQWSDDNIAFFGGGYFVSSFFPFFSSLPSIAFSSLCCFLICFIISLFFLADSETLFWLLLKQEIKFNIRKNINYTLRRLQFQFQKLIGKAAIDNEIRPSWWFVDYLPSYTHYILHMVLYCIIRVLRHNSLWWGVYIVACES